ncbi:hypothetical protein [Streptomyces brevispora]|uniref:DUF2637 domain-containing protein n=1 Tax=Streptomyces brevispora TaxID=887462 RepID=A0ABZ1G4U7_9ACTN|nr:hypothetical protein [Streptomyces brevispora]WSC14341.1 hypothetical protein OIE64_16825 [Streptomyces brevispora]
MKKDPLLWGALVAVLVVLASAEYDLARACGFGTYVAAGVPGALDIYAVKALRAKRDVTAAVVALILVNAASHLVSSGILPVKWPLVVAVSAIAPLVLWRVHRLSEAPTVVQRTTVAEPEPTPAEVDDHPAEPPAPQRYGDPVVIRPAPEVVPAGAHLLPIVAPAVTTEVTIERVAEEPQQVVTRPAIETGWKMLDWSSLDTTDDHQRPAELTGSVAAAEPRQVVTVPVTITPTELRKQARKLNREVVTTTNKPVTIERLREEYGLSRREATELRRDVVGSGRS